MKNLFYILFFLIMPFAFSQNTGLIVGKVMDGELNNSPLVLANVAVKGTNIELNTDLTGLFVIENLEDGDYTLVCSFVGYESKEIKVSVNTNDTTELKLSLKASTVSMDDLALLLASADSNNKTTSAQ